MDNMIGRKQNSGL